MTSARTGFDADDPVRLDRRGMAVPAAGAFVDPWRPVDRAIVTHGHADHAHPACAAYLCTPETAAILRIRLGADIRVDELPYGERRRVGDVTVSLHPAGHVLGSAQVRLETARGVWVLSGDYATRPNPVCAPFEPIRCDVFVSECTFGLPLYRWPETDAVIGDLVRWWRENAAVGRTSVLLTYALGKAQRVLAALAPFGTDGSAPGPVLLHGALRRLTECHRELGVTMIGTDHATAAAVKAAAGRSLVLAPPSTAGSPWMRRLGRTSLAFASGWMRIRGPRRRRGGDRGFVLSDHADWDGLHAAIDATGARRIGVTHGSVEVMARVLQERGFEAAIYPTRWEASSDGDADAGVDASEGDDAAADGTADSPSDASADVPADAPADMPTDVSADVPADAPPDASARTPPDGAP